MHWLKQSIAPSGERLFDERVIDDSISQMHAVELEDLDGDGVPELLSGKRYWAHGPEGDPGAGDPALLVYYTLGLCPAGPTFERRVIDADSGVGTQFAVADVDGDGKADVVTSNKKGLFYFRRR